MNQEVVERAFAELIARRGVHHDLGLSSGQVRTYRQRLKNGPAISTDLQLQLLKKSGWKESDAEFTRQDLVDLLTFNKRTSQAARDQGPEYIVEKWLQSTGRL